MVSSLRPVPDVATSDAVMLGHEQTVDDLRAFLEDGATRGPMCVALDGEWGSGKTSILRTLEKKIAAGGKLDVLFFNAWKYEHSGPAVGLVSEIAHMYHRRRWRREALKRTIRAAARVASSRFLGTGIDELLGDLGGGPSARALSDSLEDIVKNRTGGRRLAVLIDDLDRCGPDGALQVLSMANLFLDVEGCLCVAAVDYERMAAAWESRYRGRQGAGAFGWRYMEKLFQVRVEVPAPNMDYVAEYVGRVTGSGDGDVDRLVAELVGGNPRAIKRMHNMVCHRARVLWRHERAAGISALLWTALDAGPAGVSAGHLHSALAARGSSLGSLLAAAGGDPESVRGEVAAALGADAHDAGKSRLARLALLSRPIVARNHVSGDALDACFDALYRATRAARGRPWQ